MTSPESSDSSGIGSFDSKANGPDGFFKLIQILWQGNIPDIDPHSNYRTLVDLSLSQSLGLLEPEKRQITISDLSIFPMKQKGPSPAVALVIRSTTPEGAPHYHGCIRARNVEACPHAALAAYLFSRLHFADTKGDFEIPKDNHTKESTIAFNESTLLRGADKSLCMTEEVQQLCLSKVLALAGMEDSDTLRISKLASMHEPQKGDLDMPASSTINTLPEELLYRYAGFRSLETYRIQRDVLDPPEELLKRIFPFINDESFDIFDIFTVRIKNVLGMLRRSLVQDMVHLRKHYPNSPISQHPIFTSDLFNKFAADMEAMGGLSNTDSPVGSPSSTKDTLEKELQNMAARQHRTELEVESLKQKVDSFIQLSSEVMKTIQTFIDNQPTQPQSSPYSQYSKVSPSQTRRVPVNFVSKINNDHPSYFSIYNNARVYSGDFQYHSPMHEHMGAPYPQPPLHQHVPSHLSSLPPHPIPIPVNHIPGSIIHHEIAPPVPMAPPAVPHPMAIPIGVIPHDEKSIRRKKALNRRLSRQAVNVFEMWDDFKSLEKELVDNEVSVTEWLKLHGSSERQFRHTRQKIIRFIEEEAQITQLPIEMIKEKLHQKMKNRAKPWTLDEVQRMLSSRKRIELDYDKQT